MGPELALGYNRGGRRDWGFSMYGRVDCIEQLLKEKWAGTPQNPSLQRQDSNVCIRPHRADSTRPDAYAILQSVCLGQKPGHATCTASAIEQWSHPSLHGPCQVQLTASCCIIAAFRS